MASKFIDRERVKSYCYETLKEIEDCLSLNSDKFIPDVQIEKKLYQAKYKIQSLLFTLNNQ